MRLNAMKIVGYIVFCGTLLFVSAMAMAQGKTDEPQKGATSSSSTSSVDSVKKTQAIR